MIMAAALQALRRNKMRSALTMLGVFIGVAALIAMVAVGQGANEAVRKQIESLGTNLVVVLPGARTTGGVRGGFGSASTLTVADAQAIRREATGGRRGELPDPAAGSGPVRQSELDDQHPGRERQLSADHELADRRRTRHLARTTRQCGGAGRRARANGLPPAFGPIDNPIGALIQVKNVPLRVIGVLEAKGQSAFGQDQDDLVMIPFTTAERKVLGVAAPSQRRRRSTGSIRRRRIPTDLQPRLHRLRQSDLRAGREPGARADRDRPGHRHARAPPSHPARRRERFLPCAISARSPRRAESSSRIMALLLAAVASISLLVGGIGIMNILLVSVTERTREIGLRMAIGARRLHVLLQFLAEAMFLSVTGGIAGIIMGIIFSAVISAVAGWPTPISALAIFGGFLFSAAVGIFFGYYPARKAAHLDPIEALRYE